MVPFVVFTLVSTLVLVFSWNPVLAGILFSGLFLNALAARGATRRIRALHHSYQGLESFVSGRTSELLRGQKAVKILGAEESVVEQFRRDAEEIGERSCQVQVRSHLESVRSEVIQVVFDEGAIVQDGTYVELSSTPGPFRDLLDAQSGDSPK